MEPQTPKDYYGKTTHEIIMLRDVWRPRMGRSSYAGGSDPFINDFLENLRPYWAWDLAFIRENASPRNRLPSPWDIDNSISPFTYDDHRRREERLLQMGYKRDVYDVYDGRRIPTPIIFAYDPKKKCWVQKPDPDFTDWTARVGTTISQIDLDDNKESNIPDKIWPPEFFENYPASDPFAPGLREIQMRYKRDVYDVYDGRGIPTPIISVYDPKDKCRVQKLDPNFTERTARVGATISQIDFEDKKERNIPDNIWRPEFFENDPELDPFAPEVFRTRGHVGNPMFPLKSSSDSMPCTTNDEQWRMVVKETQELEVLSSSYNEEEIRRELPKISVIDAQASFKDVNHLHPAETTPEGIFVPTPEPGYKWIPIRLPWIGQIWTKEKIKKRPEAVRIRGPGRHFPQHNREKWIKASEMKYQTR